MKRYVIPAIALLLGTTPAWADDWAACRDYKKKSDTRVPACHRLIESGKLSKQDLAVAHRYAGDALNTDRKLAEALREYDKAIVLDPENPEFYVRRGIANWYGNRRPEALEDYSKAIELGTADATPYLVRSEHYKNQREYARAIADASHLVELSPKRDSHYMRRGILYYQNDEYDKALADFDSGLALTSRDYYNFHYMRGLTYMALQKNAEALEAFRLATDRRRAGILLKYQRGLARVDNGDYADAITDFSEVIGEGERAGVGPNDPVTGNRIPSAAFMGSTYIGRALAFLRSGRNEAALADVEKGLALQPNNQVGKEIFAHIKQSLGE
jgi:tetratricopeptide (TPR) repeat protein